MGNHGSRGKNFNVIPFLETISEVDHLNPKVHQNALVRAVEGRSKPGRCRRLGRRRFRHCRGHPRRSQCLGVSSDGLQRGSVLVTTVVVRPGAPSRVLAPFVAMPGAPSPVASLLLGEPSMIP